MYFNVLKNTRESKAIIQIVNNFTKLLWQAGEES